jgi:hypothetical protein
VIAAHRCKACGCLWRLNAPSEAIPGESWSLFDQDQKPGVCCDNPGHPMDLEVLSDPLLRFFAYEHLPAHLQVVSKPLGDLARAMVAKLPSSAERTVGLRKLLEAKDCLVRAAL